MKTIRTGKSEMSTAARNALIVLCTAAFLVPFMGSAINLALPQISTTFEMSATTLPWLATVYLMATAIFQIPFARMADIHGRKRVFLWGVALFSTSTLMCGFAPSIEILLTLRALSGVGSAMMFGTNIAILTSVFPPENRGRALGINAAVVYAALAAGPFLGGLLTHYMGWRSIFYFSSGIGIIVYFLGRTLLKGEWIESRGEKFDIKGSVMYGIALAGIIYGFSTLPNIRGIVCLCIGSLALLLFVLMERKEPFPVFNVRLFSGNRVFALSNAAALINYAATAGIGFMMSLYLQYIRGLNADKAGLVLITQAVIQSVFSLIAGNLSTRIDPSRMATMGMVIIVIGLGGLIFISPETHFWYIIILLLLLGIGFGIFSSPNTNVIMGSVEKKYYSQASAATGTMRLAGQTFSLGIAGMSISFFVGDNSLSPDNYPQFMESMKMAFIIFFALCLVGVYAASARTKRIERREI